jgi:transcriptional regulator with XRE-family HTH domain
MYHLINKVVIIFYGRTVLGIERGRMYGIMNRLFERTGDFSSEYGRMYPDKSGEQIKKLRLQAGLGIRELARLADMSAGAISAIERNQNSPTLATLHKILKALGTNFGEFFSPQPAAEENFVFGRRQMRVIEDAARRYMIAFPKHRNIQFDIIRESFSPAETNAEWEMHDCDIGGVILSGKGILEIEGRGQKALAKNDAFYVRSGLKHRLINQGPKSLELVSVFYPAKY